jgi:hypothetical protein
MCDFENYEEAVQMYLPVVTKIDSKELIPGVGLITKTSEHRQ